MVLICKYGCGTSMVKALPNLVTRGNDVHFGYLSCYMLLFIDLARLKESRSSRRSILRLVWRHSLIFTTSGVRLKPKKRNTSSMVTSFVQTTNPILVVKGMMWVEASHVIGHEIETDRKSGMTVKRGMATRIERGIGTFLLVVCYWWPVVDTVV